jgi:hypothetical protein
MPETGEVIFPVRIDQRVGHRQLVGHLVVVNDHHIRRPPRRLCQCLVTGRAAVHGDDQLAPRSTSSPMAGRIRAVAFEDPVGNVDFADNAEMPQEALHQR